MLCTSLMRRNIYFNTPYRVTFIVLYCDQQIHHKLSHCYMFRHYRVILRQPVINTLPSYSSISNAAVGIAVYYFVL